MVTQITAYEELFKNCHKPIFVRECNVSYDSRIKEIGYWLKRGKLSATGIHFLISTGWDVHITMADFQTKRFYTDIPDDFDGWIMYEENSMYEYARLTNRLNSKLIVRYCPDGDIVSDFEVAKWVDKKIAEYHAQCPIDMEVEVGTEKMFTMFNLRVMEEKIPADKIEFYWGDEFLPFNRYDGVDGPSASHPFWSFSFAELTMKIVKLGYDNLQEDKTN